MKIYIYSGEALADVIPSDYKHTSSPLFKLVSKEHDKELNIMSLRKVYLPESYLPPIEQVDKIKEILDIEKDESDVQIFSHSPYVIDFAYWYGRKLGAEIKMFNVIYDKKDIPIFEDPTGENKELVWEGLNKPFPVIEKIQRELGEDND